MSADGKQCWIVIGTKNSGNFCVIRGFLDRKQAEQAAISAMGSGSWSEATVAFAVCSWEMSKSFFEYTQTSTYGNETAP